MLLRKHKSNFIDLTRKDLSGIKIIKKLCFICLLVAILLLHLFTSFNLCQKYFKIILCIYYHLFSVNLKEKHAEKQNKNLAGVKIIAIVYLSSILKFSHNAARTYIIVIADHISGRYFFFKFIAAIIKVKISRNCY